MLTENKYCLSKILYYRQTSGDENEVSIICAFKGMPWLLFNNGRPLSNIV